LIYPVQIVHYYRVLGVEPLSEYIIRVQEDIWPSRRDWTAIVVELYKDVGDPVVKGDLVAELELEKAVIEVESSVSGKVVEVHVKKGDKVKPGDPIITLSDVS
jgi:multidrug resistance efflux pump